MPTQTVVKNVTQHSGSIGFLSLLGLLFIALKLLGLTAVAGWSWWLVLLPLYGPLAIIAGIFVIAGIAAAIGGLIALCTPKKPRGAFAYRRF